MPTEVLAPGTNTTPSSDIVIAAGDTLTLGLYTAIDDNLILPDDSPYYGGDFLLPDGASLLLLPAALQTGNEIPWKEEVIINRKDPLGEYNPTGIVLNGRVPNTILGPGTWQVVRSGPNDDGTTNVKLGVQKD